MDILEVVDFFLGVVNDVLAISNLCLSYFRLLHACVNHHKDRHLESKEVQQEVVTVK